METKNKLIIGGAALSLLTGGVSLLNDSEEKGFEKKQQQPLSSVENRTESQEIFHVSENIRVKVNASGVHNVTILNTPENSDEMDSLIESLTDKMDSIEENMKDMNSSTEINDTLSIFDEGSLRVFTDKEWEENGYKITEIEDQELENMNSTSHTRVYKNKDGVSVTRLSFDDKIGSVFIDYPDGSKISVSEFNALTYTNTEGEKIRFTPENIWSNNPFESLIGNNQLSDMSPEERDTFIESLGNTAGINAENATEEEEEEE